VYKRVTSLPGCIRGLLASLGYVQWCTCLPRVRTVVYMPPCVCNSGVYLLPCVCNSGVYLPTVLRERDNSAHSTPSSLGRGTTLRIVHLSLLRGWSPLCAEYSSLSHGCSPLCAECSPLPHPFHCWASLLSVAGLKPLLVPFPLSGLIPVSLLVTTNSSLILTFSSSF